MKKDLGIVPAVFPMPVLMIATYDENNVVDVMASSWAMICEPDEIALFLDRKRKTTMNILKNKAFTVSIADEAHMETADYFGIASANKVPDKFSRTGFTAVKSQIVNAPIIEEFPVVMECELLEEIETQSMYCLVGRIKNTKADERIVSENGKIDMSKCHALIYDECQHDYYVSDKKVGKAFHAGIPLLKG